MKILGIETSCDETAAAVVKDGQEILSNVVASQIDIHQEFGGVVPEVAARSHVEVMLPVIEKALADASSGARGKGKGDRNTKPRILDPKPSDLWDQVDGIAVTRGPGLPGALLVGVTTARTLALVKNKPLYGVDHVHAHTYANFIHENSKSEILHPKFPVLALIISGGHTQLVLFRDHFDYKMLGQTVDDAVGEAFDKVAKMLGLGFPGGPAIAKAAENGNSAKYLFPKPKLANPFDFSFSGIKTAVLRHLQGLLGKDDSFSSHKIAPLLKQRQVNDTAASFQQTVVEIMVDKTKIAFGKYSPKTVVIAGGVAANQELRHQLKHTLKEFGSSSRLLIPSPKLCTDNAAMIATLAYHCAKNGRTVDPLKLETEPSLTM